MRKANFKLIFKASASILFLLHSTGCNSLTQGKGNTTAVGTTIAPPNSSSVVVQNSGSGQYGTNGYGSSNVNTPVGIQNPTLSLGNSISFFKDNNAYIFGFGAGFTTAPTVANWSNAAIQDVKISQLGGHLCYRLTSSRTLYCLGQNDFGQAGIVYSQSNVLTPQLEVSVPVSDYALGYHHSCYILDNLTVWCFGDNTFGQIGSNPSTGFYPKSYLPLQVMANPATSGGATNIPFTAQSLAIGADHTCALHSVGGVSGYVSCWGFQGRLGSNPVGSTSYKYTPTLIADSGTVSLQGGVSQLAAGAFHTCIIKNSQVYCWGANSFGQTDASQTSTVTNYSVPVQVNLSTISGFSGTFIPESLSLGKYHTCVVGTTKALVCWGANDYNQIASASAGSCSGSKCSPTLVFGTPTGTNSGVSKLSVGDYHTCAVHNGDLKCWGKSNAGQAGIPTTNSPSPRVTSPQVIVYGSSTQPPSGLQTISVSISPSGNVVNNGTGFSGATTITVQFSQSVTGFTVSDMLPYVTNATISNFAGSGSTYTFTLTPTGVSGSHIELFIPAGSASDSSNSSNLNIDSMYYMWTYSPSSGNGNPNGNNPNPL